MTTPDEDSIRRRAYAIWEREGRPHGRDRDHWLQAQWELTGEEAAASHPAEEILPLKPKAAPRKKAAARKAEAK